MSKLTSVEWLVEQVNSDCLNSVFIKQDLIEKAKEMYYREMMESMQRGMELQEKENNRIGFRERNKLLDIPK